MSFPVFEALADDALLLRLGERIEVELNARAHAIAGALRARAPAWLVDVVPAYASVAVFFDVAALGGSAHAQVELALRDVLHAAAQADAPARIVEIPVCYGGAHGQDLDACAQELGLSADTLVERHAAGRYRVGMIGFAPGFPYLLGLDPALASPRLATPRTQVPAGSVAIGGAQTGIYPAGGAGGWRLLGRTPLRLFDPTRDQPCLLSPGDTVRFASIDAARFDAWRP
jgi:KipI family sensor histidine kinase inhibitor